MNSPIKLSIIVPIYNVAGYLRDCLDSILRQQLAAYEVLLINDGATDTSGLIAQEYATTNPDVFVYIEQKNRGLSGARNTGIDAARGDYLFFMDSDDYLADMTDAKKESLRRMLLHWFNVNIAPPTFFSVRGVIKIKVEVED
jgi:CDP-glycerol glycerophosphotransferase